MGSCHICNSLVTLTITCHLLCRMVYIRITHINYKNYHKSGSFFLHKYTKKHPCECAPVCASSTRPPSVFAPSRFKSLCCTAFALISRFQRLSALTSRFCCRYLLCNCVFTDH
ncbi:hypothetical protein Plhal304r1_c022g0076631 [Plasmopara halstedii]